MSASVTVSVEPVLVEPAKILGVVLAGGQGRRMGVKNKALLRLAGRPLLDHVLARLAPQVSAIIINANDAPERLACWGLPVVGDVIPGFGGPLVGVLSAMEWALAQDCGYSHIVSAPVDCPFLPRDLVARLTQAANVGEVAQARSGSQIMPVVGLWPVVMAAALRHALVVTGIASVKRWTADLPCVIVDFEITDGLDPFLNINTPADLAEAERVWDCWQGFKP